MTAKYTELTTNEFQAYTQERLELLGVVRTCVTCEHSDVEKGVCMRYNTVPPMKVIARGCPDWKIKLPF